MFKLPLFLGLILTSSFSYAASSGSVNCKQKTNSEYVADATGQFWSNDDRSGTAQLHVTLYTEFGNHPGTPFNMELTQGSPAPEDQHSFVFVEPETKIKEVVLGFANEGAKFDSSIQTAKGTRFIMTCEFQPQTQLGTLDTADRLLVSDLIKGVGPVAERGNTVRFQYRGKLANGTEFGSTYSSNTPITSFLAPESLIQGLVMGIAGVPGVEPMRVGGKRSIVVPAEFAKGFQTNLPIPAEATLYFEVELLEVNPRMPAAFASSN